MPKCNEVPSGKQPSQSAAHLTEPSEQENSADGNREKASAEEEEKKPTEAQLL